MHFSLPISVFRRLPINIILTIWLQHNISYHCVRIGAEDCCAAIVVDRCTRAHRTARMRVCCSVYTFFFIVHLAAKMDFQCVQRSLNSEQIYTRAFLRLPFPDQRDATTAELETKCRRRRCCCCDHVIFPICVSALSIRSLAVCIISFEQKAVYRSFGIHFLTVCTYTQHNSEQHAPGQRVPIIYCACSLENTISCHRITTTTAQEHG